MTRRTAIDEQDPGAGERVALLEFTHSQLQDWVLSQGQPRYRSDQLYSWLYGSLAPDFEGMRNLPQSMRQRLGEMADIQRLAPLQDILSSHGLTRKVLFALSDGETIESVLMRYDERNTVCLSTQVGCSLGCTFCATGHSGFTRNLSAGEILEQTLYFARELREEGQRITNVVFMGMGEPLMNYEATWQAIETLTDSRGFNLGARRITISTVGIIPGIKRLSGEKLQVGLAVSLHAPNDELRKTLAPITRRYPVKKLIAACRTYFERKGRRVTFEYALVDRLNDSRQQAAQLATLLEGLLCHVNLIPLNPVQGSPWRGSSRERVRGFHRKLNRLGVNSTIRLRRGTEIEAGCGQLRSRWPGRQGAQNCLSS